MTDEPEELKEPRSTRNVSRWAVARSVFGTVLTVVFLLSVVGGVLAIRHPETPLPPEWNPIAPLSVNQPVTPLTSWKLRRSISDPAVCLDVLATGSSAEPMSPFEWSDNCHIRNRVRLDRVGGAAINSVETTCATALITALWTHHGIQPAAEEILGGRVVTVRQIGSYNCRPINTTSGPSNRWSTHATAEAIDITGFDLDNGSRIRLINDWEGDTPEARFLRRVRDSACNWFGTTLGPDFNSLHADHFHLQVHGWGTCR